MPKSVRSEIKYVRANTHVVSAPGWPEQSRALCGVPTSESDITLDRPVTKHQLVQMLVCQECGAIIEQFGDVIR